MRGFSKLFCYDAHTSVAHRELPATAAAAASIQVLLLEGKWRAKVEKVWPEPKTSSYQQQASLEWQPKMHYVWTALRGVWSSYVQWHSLCTELLWSGSVHSVIKRKGKKRSVTNSVVPSGCSPSVCFLLKGLAWVHCVIHCDSRHWQLSGCPSCYQLSNSL